MVRWVLFLILTCSLLGSQANAQSAKEQIQEQKFKMEEITDACSKVQDKDKICGMLLQIRQIGNDAVEFAKAYLDLTPHQYALLTVANSVATGRVRMQTSAPMFADASVAVDIKRSETQVIFMKSF